MKNFKLVKTAAAVALGASVVTAAVVPGSTDASAASKYKVSNGKLVNAKTGKVVKGYVVYKSKLYYNGKLKKGYKTVGSGKTIKLYYNGSLKQGYKTAKNNKLLFFNGSLKKGYKTAGNGERLYKDGQLDKGYEVYGDVDNNPSLYYNGYLKSGYKTANNATLLFYNGKLKEGYKTAQNDTRLYKDGRQNKGLVVVNDLLFDGFNQNKGTKVFEGKLYNGAHLNEGLALVDGVLYDGSKENEGLKLFEEKLYNGSKENEGLKLFEGTLYKDAKVAEGVVKFEDKFYKDGKLADGTFDYEGKEIAVEKGVEVGAKVKSVEAINATEILVTSNRTLSKESAEKVANYEVFLNGSTSTDVIKSAKLQADGKSVLVRFTTPAVVNESIKVATKASLLTSNYEKLAAFTTDVKLFSDVTAPTLKSVDYNGTNVVATFSEPVKSTGNIRVDGATVSLGSAVEDVAGNYQYVLTNAPTKAGTHDVVISQIKDFNNNETGTQKGSYTIVENAAAPAVSKVEAVTSNSFKVTFDKAIAGTTAADAVSNLVVKKGSNTLATSRVTGVIANDKKSITYTVSTSSADEVKLYGDNETTANLTVSFDGYKDANGLLGAAYSGNVTLSKDDKAPALLSKNLVSVDSTNKVVTLTFDEAVDAVAAKNADIVIKKDGIVQSAAAIAKPTVDDVSSDTTERTVTLTFGNALADGEYELVLPKGLVQDKESNDSVSDTISFKVSSAVSFFVPTVTAPVASGTTNVITVSSTNDFTDSAKELANYTLDDASLPAGTTIDFVDNKKKVEIKLPDSFKVTSNASYKLGISSKVKDSTGASVAANATTGGVFTDQVALVDNVAPTLSSAKLVADDSDATKFNKITLTFSEALQALGNTDELKDFVVTVNGSEVPVQSVSLNADNKKVDLVIGDGQTLYAITQQTVVKVAPVSSTNTVVDIKDLQGNALTTGTSVTATK